MKIAILSMHRVANSGSFLQAYGLKKIVENYGHKVEFIDFSVKFGTKAKFKKILKGNIFRNVAYRLRYFNNKGLCLSKIRYLDFCKLYETYVKDLGVDETRYVVDNHDYDMIVYGSDEIFNICQYNERGCKIPWEIIGGGISDVTKISYAASAGDTNVEKIEKLGLSNRVKHELSQFQYLSVRDGNTQEIVRKYAELEPVISLDPVLVYDFKEANMERNIMEPYILVYAYPGRFSAEEILQIKKVAHTEGKKIVCVNFDQPFSDEYVVTHPLNVLSYFYHADAIITDTFHGAIMSIKYLKNFCAYVRKSNKNKLGFLLDLFGLDNRIITVDNPIEKIINTNLDEKKVKGLLEEYKEKSMLYLDKVLKG